MATGELFQDERDRQVNSLMKQIFTSNVKRSYVLKKRTRQETIALLQDGGWHNTLDIADLLGQWDMEAENETR